MLFGTFGGLAGWFKPTVVRLEYLMDAEDEEIVRRLRTKGHELHWVLEKRLRESQREGWKRVTKWDKLGRRSIFMDSREEIVLLHRPPTRIRRHGIPLAIGSLALCLACSAWAQANLERGKTAAQLYAANCVSCHKSPQSVSKTTGIFGLESFLREHYTTSSQSAATLAAYLNGLPKRSSGSVRAHPSGQANSSKPRSGQIKDEKSSVSRALNGAADTMEQTLNKLLAR
jgi:hypothetical protein